MPTLRPMSLEMDLDHEIWSLVRELVDVHGYDLDDTRRMLMRSMDATLNDEEFSDA